MSRRPKSKKVVEPLDALRERVFGKLQMKVARAERSARSASAAMLNQRERFERWWLERLDELTEEDE